MTYNNTEITHKQARNRGQYMCDLNVGRNFE